MARGLLVPLLSKLSRGDSFVSTLALPFADAELEAADPLFASAPFTAMFGRIQSVRTDTYSLWGHSLAVGMTSLRLARALELDLETCVFAYFGGVLHDVGKSMSRLETLFKVGPLDGAEMAHIRQHPADGARMLEGVCPRRLVEAVRNHHELYDGSGYPDRLVGDATPLLARVVGVADYFEALREHRVYRPGRGKSEASRMLAREAEAGRLDPSIVMALLRIA